MNRPNILPAKLLKARDFFYRQKLRERAADAAEHAVNCGGNVVNTGNAHESDQGNQQSVFDQILTFLAILQILKFHIQILNCAAHLFFSQIVEFRPGRFVLTPRLLMSSQKERNQNRPKKESG